MRGLRRRLGRVWEALTVAGLVAAFLAVAGLAGLTVYRLWSTSGTGNGHTSGSGGADSLEG